MPAANLHLIKVGERHFLAQQGLARKIKEAIKIPARGIPARIELGSNSFTVEQIEMAEGALFAVDASVAVQMIEKLGLELGEDGIAAQVISGA